MTELADNLRDQWMADGLDREDLDPNPFRQFEHWFEQAIDSGIPEPNAFSLATVDANGQAWARTVLLKLYDEDGFVFFTNYESHKARQIAANNRVAMLFPWVGLGRQVKIAGVAGKIPTAESMKYFATRPRGSQIGAWASQQSAPLESREVLIQRVRELEEKYAGGEVPRPPFWTGFRLSPERVEFWWAREFRLHDRFEYTLQAGRWVKRRLNP